MADERQNPPDLDLLSPLVARARGVLVGKSRSYVNDAIDFARALIAAAEELERLKASTVTIRELREENARLVEEYAGTLVRANGVVRPIRERA